MSKQKSELKNAFKALRIHEPLRISKEVRFKAPADEPQPKSENLVGCSPTVFFTQTVNTPVGRETGNSKNTQWVINPEEKNSTGSRQTNQEPLVDLPSGFRETAQPVVEKPIGSVDVEVSLPVGKNTKGFANPEVSPPTEPKTQSGFDPEVNLSRGGNDHGGSLRTREPLERMEQYVPDQRGPLTWRETKGELYLPHKLLEFAVKVTGSRNELCLLLFFIRYTLGFRRGHCQAGYTFLTEWTGIGDISNLKKALKTLLSAGLIIKIKEHDSINNTGAVYEVPVVKCFLEDPGGDPKNSPDNTGGKKVTASGNTQRAENRPASGSITHGPLGNLPTKKENKKENLNKPLSEAKIPESLLTEISAIRSPKKRMSESRSLQQLLQNFEVSEVVLGYEHLKNHGVLGSGNKCHTPFGYLAIAGDDVISAAREKLLVEETKVIPILKGEVQKDQVELSPSEREQVVHIFETELPTETKESLVSNFIRQEGYPKDFMPPAKVLRALVALRWARSRGIEHRSCAG